MDQSLRKTRRQADAEVNRATLARKRRNCLTSMLPLGIHRRQSFEGPPKVLCQGRVQSLDCGHRIGLVKNRPANCDSMQAGLAYFGNVICFDAADGERGQ